MGSGDQEGKGRVGNDRLGDRSPSPRKPIAIRRAGPQAATRACRCVGILAWIACGVLTSPLAKSDDARRDDQQIAQAIARPARRAALIEFRGDIHALSEQYLYRKLDAARKLNVDLVILDIESKGGDAEASIRMGQRLRDLGWARTVAYVPTEALSGAAIFALGCDEIVMHPSAVFGDAGPIFLDENFLFQHASEKYRSHLARQVRDLAESKGRPTALAEAMVDMNLVVFQVTNRTTGQVTYKSQAEIDASQDPEDWERGKPVLESRAEHFLEVSGKRAVELKLADATVDSLSQLKTRYEPLEAWTELKWSSFDTLVLVLNHPIATGILLVVGLVALYLELAAPGLGLGGITALVCFALFFWSRFLGGTAEWLDLILFAAGIVLLLVEFFVIPGFGIWGGTGILLILSALVLASQSFLVPRTREELQLLTRAVSVILISMAAFVVAAGVLTRRLGQIPGLSRLLLTPPTPAMQMSSGSANGSRLTETFVNDRWVRLGERGQAQSPLRPAGRIRIGNDYIDVVSDGTFIDAGQWVQVIDVRGNRIVVRQADAPA